MADTTFAQLERLAQAWERIAATELPEIPEMGFDNVDDMVAYERDEEMQHTYRECAAQLRKILSL